MFVGAVFLGAGATLAVLRKRAATSNECHDFQEDHAPGLSKSKSCCSSTVSLTGLLESAEKAEEEKIGEQEPITAMDNDSELELTCKFCEPTACCRFCFAGPEIGELCAPCLCVGSQELVHYNCLRQWQLISMRTRGVREKKCRVCNAPFREQNQLASLKSKIKKVKLWFSLKARDRLDNYSNAWWHALLHVIQLERRDSQRIGTRPTIQKALARPVKNLCKELFWIGAVTEVCVWAGRELKRDDGASLAQEARVIKTGVLFGSIVAMKRGGL